MYEKILKQLNNYIENITSILLVIMVVLVFLQIVSRAIFSFSFPWTEEAARYLMVWVIFLGSSVAFQHGSHISIEFFMSKMKHRLAKWIQLLASVTIFSFLIILFMKGIEIIDRSMVQRSAAMQLPMGYVYLVMPISAVLMMINVIDFTIKSFRIHPLEIGKREKGEA